MLGAEQGLHAEAVPRQKQAPPGAIIDGERENPTQPLHHPLAQVFVEMHENLGVRRASEDVTVALELRPQRAVVIDLAVEDHVDGRGFVRHRLVAGGRQVDQGETTVHQLALRVMIRASPVGTAVCERCIGSGTPLGRWRQDVGVEAPRYAAHGRVPPSRVVSCPLAKARARTHQKGL